VLADPVGSTIGGGEHGDYDIEGIGNDFTPATMDMSLVEQVIKVTDRDAIAVVKLLAHQEAIIAGSSSGAAVWASLELANELAIIGVASAKTPVNIVTVLPDRGDRYLSKGLFD
jgi:cysteine synthase A